MYSIRRVVSYACNGAANSGRWEAKAYVMMSPSASRQITRQSGSNFLRLAAFNFGSYMQNLFENILIGLGTGLASGFITGLYSGLIISRRNRFDSLRADLLRHINSIEYMQEEHSVVVNRGTISHILYIASDFAHFGHRKAAEASIICQNSINSTLFESERGLIDVAVLELRINAARDACRSIKPSPKIYLPWGRI